MSAIVLGGGPCGLALVDGLVEETAHRFVLLERDTQLGGLAKTLTWGPYGSHDLGPHKIFTTDASLLKRVESLLPPGDWLVRQKTSRIFLEGRYLPYPPSPFSLLAVYGPLAFLDMVKDFGLAKAASWLPREPALSFEDDLTRRVGRRLFRDMFQPMAEKLWDTPSKLDVKLSRGRIQTPSIAELVGRALRLRKSSAFEALEFKYPRRGVQSLWNAIQGRTRGRGEYLLGREVTGMSIERGRVTELRYRGAGEAQDRSLTVGAGDFVFSTLPLGKLVDLTRRAGYLDAALCAAAREAIALNDLTLVFLKIREKRLLGDSWVFVPDRSILFHRVSEQPAFDPGMTPDGSIVFCEIMGRRGGGAPRTDRELVAEVIHGLSRMGLTPTVEDSRVIRLPASYPVFRVGYEEVLGELLERLDGIANLRTLGRQGAFNYIGTLDAMDIGYGAARWYAATAAPREETGDAGGWRQERERTRHYPVLD